MSDEKLNYKIAELAEGSETADEAELRDLLHESLELLSKIRDERVEGRLAKSIFDFAEWQNSGYAGTKETKNTIGRALWAEVSENVYRVIEATPAPPRFD